MRQNTTDARYDQTRYANFDPKMVASMSADDLRDENQITDRQWDRMVDHFRGSDARSVAEMIEEVPYWTWFGDDEVEHLAACAAMHADNLEVELPPLEDPKGKECECDADADSEGKIPMGRIVRTVLEESGHGDANVHVRDSGEVRVQLHRGEGLIDVVTALLDRSLSVDVDQGFEVPPQLNVRVSGSIRRAVKFGMDDLTEGSDANGNGGDA